MPVNPKHGAAAAVALAIAVVLGGCVPEEASPTPTPTPSVAAPVFASEAEALAAAEEAYAAYLAMLDLVAQEGGREPERMAQVATEELANAALEGNAEFEEAGYRSVGSSSFRDIELQQIEDNGRGDVTVSVYLCNDISAVDVLNANGDSVVPDDRVDTTLLLVKFVNAIGGTELRVAERVPWSAEPC